MKQNYNTIHNFYLICDRKVRYLTNVGISFTIFNNDNNSNNNNKLIISIHYDLPEF